MILRVRLIPILLIIACLVVARRRKVKVKHGPSGMSYTDGTNCSEFSKFGRFNPYSILNEKWFVFYYWAERSAHQTYYFFAPSTNHTKHLKRLLDGNCVLPVMWAARRVLMEDKSGFVHLLVERSDRGEYWMYPVPTKANIKHKITPRDIRLKQTGDNRILGLMDCVDESLLVMARINEVPRKAKLLEEASRLGYRSRKGKSYLYQGHEWGPIPEADEKDFWEYSKQPKGLKDSSKEDKSTERSSEEEESQETGEQDDSKQKKRKVKQNKGVTPDTDGDDEKCIKVEPELWNDPKPNPNPDNLITKEELSNLDINNTLTIEVPDGSPNTTQESNLNKTSQNTQDNDKLDNHQNLQEVEMPLNAPNNLELTDDPDSEKENCVVCFKSEVSFINGKSYSPDSTSSTTNLNNNEESSTQVLNADIPLVKVRHDEVSNVEVPLGEVTHVEVPDGQVSHVEVTHATVLQGEVSHVEVPLDEVSHVEVPAGKVSHVQVSDGEVLHVEAPHAAGLQREVLHVEVPNTAVPLDEVSHVKVPASEVLHVEIPHAEVPHGEVPSAEVRHDVIPHAEVPHATGPQGEVSHVEVPLDEVSHVEVPFEVVHVDVPYTAVPLGEVSHVKVPASQVSHVEIPHATVPQGEVPSAEVRHDVLPQAAVPHGEEPHAAIPHDKASYGKVSREKLSHAKSPSRPLAPIQDSDNSSKIIIMSQLTLGDIKIEN